MNRKPSLALMAENYYRNTSKPAAPLSDMRNPAGLFLGNPDGLVKSNKLAFIVIPAQRSHRNSDFRHSGQAQRDPESRNIKEFWIPAFAGMTAFYYSDTAWQAGIQLLQNVLDTGTRIFHDVCRCNDDLTFQGVFNNISPNNTLHASRRICAPWGVTFFLAFHQVTI